MEFKAFPKVPRLNREVVVTEKIDGTNAQVYIVEVSQIEAPGPLAVSIVGDLAVYAGSRTRWITPESDNFGFAAWVRDHAEELVTLGPGQHFGEWWGAGIQRRYGLAEKRFSLFNVGRWHDAHGTNPPTVTKRWDPKARELSTSSTEAPACCYVVPVLNTFQKLDTVFLAMEVDALRKFGSKAAPGFMNPEGIVAFHAASGGLFKVTCEKDDEWKGKTA